MRDSDRGGTSDKGPGSPGEGKQTGLAGCRGWGAEDEREKTEEMRVEGVSVRGAEVVGTWGKGDKKEQQATQRPSELPNAESA